MDDLGRAMAGAHGPVRMLGGGNPAHIPEMQAIWRNRMAAILADPPAFDRMMTNYDPPVGNARFIAALANLLRKEFGWNLAPENIAITAGGQTAFFLLFNLLAGEFRNGRRKTILLPLVPEYIGYMNQGLAPGLLRAVEPRIEFLPGHRFKYHVDFGRLAVSEDVAALCVSRPTNPSGNVLTNSEVHRLAAIARASSVPLIIDNAYGVPFPGILFRDADPIWDENIILTLSLSKLGLPNTRTGIVVARPEIIRAVASMTAIVGLANCSIGQAIVLPLVKSGEILRLAREVVRPFYERKSRLAQEWIAQFFDDGLDYHVHVSEGALFLVAMVSRDEDFGGNTLLPPQGARRPHCSRPLFRRGRGRLAAWPRMHPAEFRHGRGLCARRNRHPRTGGGEGVFVIVRIEGRLSRPSYTLQR